MNTETGDEGLMPELIYKHCQHCEEDRYVPEDLEACPICENDFE